MDKPSEEVRVSWSSTLTHDTSLMEEFTEELKNTPCFVCGAVPSYRCSFNVTTDDGQWFHRHFCETCARDMVRFALLLRAYRLPNPPP